MYLLNTIINDRERENSKWKIEVHVHGVITGAKLGASPEESLPCNKYCSPTFPFRLSLGAGAGPLGAGVGPTGAGVGPRGDVRGTGGGLRGSASAQAHLFVCFLECATEL